jgi:pyruvate dehydrogenase E1 component
VRAVLTRTEIVTTSPDVTVSTNLGAWVNQRGLFRRQGLADVFAAAKIPSAQKWGATNAGQHIELGIAENNLFLMLAALGLAETSSANGCSRSAPSTILHRPRPRCAQLRLLSGCTLHAGGDALGRDAGAGGRRAPVDQSAADRARTAGPSPLRTCFVDELALLMEEGFR